ncbi:hypothetical protein ASPZODRAFT_131733 [Penicilliopsis zonata CBS 506.65]|uniref:NmrA-like family domain-containing protein 1 n=1 Tax=Penicilliopsis zonata CBS 506.65 TaxID=1073090 RepID=A0A1L9SIB5_9EURO|nr:hypothetical protein ASPZODRAFT_131733 [Penicilliopsis zonata CBS 506.65]OJJ46841.1 hypothetical protein ASPZODRAFT_131733 [Penicilliopsis zonata CBS 506.65]
MSGTIVVFGATGKQGGSVVESLLQTTFHVKAITRNPASKNAQALSSKGVEVVQADLNDSESLRTAIRGAYGVYAVTNFWEHLDGQKEIEQGKRIADICVEEGVQHLVWSSLLNVTKLTNGVLSHVYHFDSKAEVEEYIRTLDIKATFFLPGFYMSNIAGMNLRQAPDGSGTRILALPILETAPIPLFASENDTGKFVKAIFLKREETLGKRIYGATAYTTPIEIVQVLREESSGAGQDVVYSQLPHDVFKGALGSLGMPEPVQEELLQNMRLMAEFGYYGGDSLGASIAIVDEPLTTWREYVRASPALKA